MKNQKTLTIDEYDKIKKFHNLNLIINSYILALFFVFLAILNLYYIYINNEILSIYIEISMIMVSMIIFIGGRSLAVTFCDKYELETEE